MSITQDRSERRGAPSVDVVLPVFNEEKALPGSLATLHAFLSQNLDNPIQSLLIVGAIFILINLLVDLSYPFLDPRLRTSK